MAALYLVRLLLGQQDDLSTAASIQVPRQKELYWEVFARHIGTRIQLLNSDQGSIPEIKIGSTRTVEPVLLKNNCISAI